MTTAIIFKSGLLGDTITVIPALLELRKKIPNGRIINIGSDSIIFNLQGKETTVRRALILLEDWKPGHYLEVMGVPYVEWRAGQVVEWVYDTPHMAANIGLEDRYTLQITGHI